MRPEGRGWLWGLVALLVALFVWGATQVVTMPLETGEVYPEYSSLRADPMGAKALFESLEALPELSVSRLFKERTVLDAGEALVVLGVNPGGWVDLRQNVITDYEKLVEKGGRLVIAFVPVRMPSPVPSPSPVLKDRWHIQLTYRAVPEEPDARTLSAQQRQDLIPRVPRRSALAFEPGAEWRTLESQDHDAVAVERVLGNGSIVLIADSFPLSNEGLSESRNAELIVSMVGGARRVAFDENHFGVSDTGSVGTLLRKYGLEGGAGVLIVSAALFMWRMSSSLLPSRRPAADEAVAGRDAQEGLTSLLRRSVPEADLLNVCYAEWNRAAPAARKAAAVEAAIMGTKGRDVAARYRAACLALKEKR